ncbi:DEAH-box ATP-dependent RNA helicase prp43 [Pleurotus ostreatus]|nr:DEAH-box ATP-dependent RNA helicase prp43 [Pleurotus ostreatus]
MQVAHRTEGGGYVTVKENHFAKLHPSYGGPELPEWVLFNEFIITGRSFLRTVSAVSPEWLLEIAPSYFNLRTFPDGKTRRALENLIEQKTAGSSNNFRSLYTMEDAVANLTGASAYTLEDAVAGFSRMAPRALAISRAREMNRARRMELEKRIQQIRHRKATRAASSRSINPVSLYTMEDAIANVTGTSAYTIEDAVSRFTQMTLDDYSLLFHR